MSATERATDRGRRAVLQDLRQVVDDLRQTRITVGISQDAMAAALGVSQPALSRIERHEVVPELGRLGAMAAVLGLGVRIATYPEGEPLRDSVQPRILGALRARVAVDRPWRFELALPLAGDRRAWDAAVIDSDGIIAFEGISRFGAADATIRRVRQKQRDDPRVKRVILVVLDTVRNREALAAAAGLLRAEFPLGTREVLAALDAGVTPPLDGVILQRLPPRGSSRPPPGSAPPAPATVASSGPGSAPSASPPAASPSRARSRSARPAPARGHETPRGLPADAPAPAATSPAVRPQVLHTGAELVDDSGRGPPQLVDNPVGRPSGGPYRRHCPKGPHEDWSGGDRLKAAPPGKRRSLVAGRRQD